MIKLKARKEWIIAEADSIEASAKASHRAWILLGQESKYVEEMGKVAALRRIAEEKSVKSRRESLRNLGYDV
jgi:hypothetical protein